MSLVCALSGVTPEEPVYSPTGYIFEKRLIDKHLKANTTCPISGEELSANDLQAIRTTKIAKPRPVTATSIPGLLSLFQNEWDATMVETFTLRQHVEQVRSQLSQTLYQHDASCRVIARLLRERNSAQSRVGQLQQRLAEVEATVAAGGAVDAEPGLSNEDFAKVIELSTELPKDRKKRSKAPPYSLATFHSLTCLGSYPLHQTTTPGVTCCTVDPKPDSPLIATGGVDGFVVLFDAKQKRTRSRLSGHMKRVNRVRMHASSSVVLSASDDKTLRVWRQADAEGFEYVSSHIIRKHLGPVVDMAIHPVGTFAVSCAKDHSWALHDIASGRTLCAAVDQPTNYRCVNFHPDGALLAAGDEDGAFEIWDMKDKKPSQKIVSLAEEHQAAINCIAFSENGIHAATASNDATIKLWDLRKPVVFQTLKANGGDPNAPFTSVAYDRSANYIVGASGNVISLYNIPQKALAAAEGSLSGHTATVTDLCFGHDAEFLVSTSMDRTVKLWEPSQVDEAMEEAEDEEEDKQHSR